MMKTIFKLCLFSILLASIFFSRIEAVTWDTVVDISPSAVINNSPKIASDLNGNAMAVWVANSGNGYMQVMANYYTVGVGWDATPTALSLIGPPGGNAYIPDVSMDNLGNAMAIWQRGNGTTFDIQIALYTKLTNTWSSPLNISPTGQQAITPAFSFDAAGNGIATWNSINNKIQAATYTRSTNTWSTVNDISGSLSSNNPYLAVNPNGKAIVIWLADNETKTLIQANVYDGSTWGTPTTISEANLNSSRASVAIDQTGNGIAIWGDTRNNLIKVANYDQALATWSSPVTISPIQQIASIPAIAIVPSTGNAIAIWQQYNGAANMVYGATYTSSTSTWSNSTIISPVGGSAEDLKIVVDSQGNAVAFWRYFNGSIFILQTSSYDVLQNTWSTPQDLSLPGIAGRPSAFVNTAASLFNVFVTWSFTTDQTNYVIQSIKGDTPSTLPFFLRWFQ